MVKLYCFFCAEDRSSEKLIHIDSDQQVLADTEQKLATLNITFPIYIKDSNFVPRTFCLVCCEALLKACEFLERFKKAQEFLSNIYPEKLNSNDEDAVFNEESTLIIDDGPHSDVNNEDDQPLTCVEWKPNNNLKQHNDHDYTNLTLDGVTIDAYANLCTKVLYIVPEKSINRWSGYTWFCKHCNVRFPTVDDLRRHSRDRHRRCFAFKCIDCDEALEFSKKNSFEEFLNHVSSHRKELHNICPYCNKNYKNEPNHLQFHYPEPKVQCKTCGDILRSEKTLKRHINEFVVVKQKQRRKGQPLTEEELTCGICKKVCNNLETLRKHKARHTAGERKPEFTCEHCGKTYFSKHSLITHIQITHQKVKPYKCRICNKAFLFPSRLRRHITMHSTSKPFICDRCGHSYRLKEQLVSHQIVHTDTMPYNCNFCDKRFRFKHNLVNHERQHTGAKPYSCEDCGLRFTNWPNANKHMKRRHGMTLAKKKLVGSQ